MKKGRGLFLVIGGVLLLGSTAPTAVATADSTNQDRGRQGPPENLQPGDRVEDHGVVVTVPRRGFGIWEEDFLDNGTTQQLAVTTSPDGDVVVEHWGSDSGSSEGAWPSSGDNACSDIEFDLHSWKWTTTFNWYWNPGTRPDELTALQTETRDTLRKATRNITQTNNDCGRVDAVSASASFQGASSITSTLCGSDQADGVSLVRFTNIATPTTRLATACTRYTYNGIDFRATESDVIIDKDNHEWYVNFSSSFACQTSTDPDGYSLEALMTHERGHTFGIAHNDQLKGDAGENAHPFLTMSPKINGSCQNSEATLGLGDMLGLETKY